MKARKPPPTSKHPKTMAKKLDIDEFMRGRRPATAMHTAAELDRITEEALSKIDQEAAYKEIVALRERYGIEPGPRARRRTK